RQSRTGGGRAQNEALWRHRIGGGSRQDYCLSGDKRQPVNGGLKWLQNPCFAGRDTARGVTSMEEASPSALRWALCFLFAAMIASNAASLCAHQTRIRWLSCSARCHNERQSAALGLVALALRQAAALRCAATCTKVSRMS